MKGICLPRLHFFRTIKVNDRQAQFANEYLVDLNATQTAIRAGYSPKTAGQQGFELLKKPEIQIAVQNAQAERIERTKVDADWVVKRLVTWCTVASRPNTSIASVTGNMALCLHSSNYTAR